jgi:hypothetical protein
MNEFIRHATPLALSLFLGLIGVAAVLISKGAALTAETDPAKRKKAAIASLVSALPPNLCRSSFSYDIWVVTALFSSDPKTLAYYNLADKHSAIQLLMVVHIILFLVVASWGGIVRGGIETEGAGLELICALVAVALCIVFQVY